MIWDGDRSRSAFSPTIFVGQHVARPGRLPGLRFRVRNKTPELLGVLSLLAGVARLSKTLLFRTRFRMAKPSAAGQSQLRHKAATC